MSSIIRSIMVVWVSTLILLSSLIFGLTLKISQSSTSMKQLFRSYSLWNGQTAILNENGHRDSSLYMFGKKNDDKEAILQEQMRIQQEMLARRKNKSKMDKYFESVDERREMAAKESKITQYARSDNSVDPIEKWREAKRLGKVKDIGYEAEPPKSSSKFGVNIVIPLNPIGMPKYDAGERFDLRLPYAERGYEDEDADIMWKIGKGLASLFGMKKDSKDEQAKNDSKDGQKKK